MNASSSIGINKREFFFKKTWFWLVWLIEVGLQSISRDANIQMLSDGQNLLSRSSNMAAMTQCESHLLLKAY